MSESPVRSAASELEAFVEGFEDALWSHGDRDLTRHLPHQNHPLFARILSEFIRIDLEYGWERGTAQPLTDYRRQFPDFFRDPALVKAVAFEEYRLRRRAGDHPSAEQYE